MLPTKDYLKWDGTKFRDDQKQNPGPESGARVAPEATVRLPEPAILPEKVVLACVRVSVLLPRATAPLPASVAMAAPPLPAYEISNVPLSATSLEAAMLPELLDGDCG